MAPPQQHAVATVVSAQVLSHDEASILIEAGGIKPADHWLRDQPRHDSASTDEEDYSEPPKKRRKKITWNEIHSNATPDSTNDILVKHLAIDLHFPETLQGKTPSAKAIREDVDFDDSTGVAAQPKVIDLFENGVRFNLASCRKKGAVLVIETTGTKRPVLDVLREMLASRFNKKSSLKAAEVTDLPKDNIHPATYCKCILRRSRGLHTVIRLEASLYWRSGSSAFPVGVPTGRARVYADYDTLTERFPLPTKPENGQNEPWSPQDFYSAVHVPARDRDTAPDFQGLLESELYPFQKRAVHWLLRREGVEYTGNIVRTLPKPQRPPDLRLYSQAEDLEGRQCFVNFLQGIVARDAPADEPRVLGGILAEEMGLGKTVELIALLSLHKRTTIMPDTITDLEQDTRLRPSKATLIITPNTILEQWKSELTRHAPALKVIHYRGTNQQKTETDNGTIGELSTGCDVVLTTYQTLAKEVHFAEDPPDRDMRHKRRYKRKRSPLVQIHWWRICLDEAQMVESGVTAAARVARRLPRVHSWAVSGTPLRKNLDDLHGLLIFLRFRPFCDNVRLWSHLLTNHKHLFAELFGQLALRHTKAQIREDLNLPAQKRVVITVPFSAIEQQQYTTLFKQMCDEVGVTSDGSPRTGEWDPEEPATVEQMRRWLVRLRQTCLHPQVGSQNRKALGRGQGPLRTVSEVLTAMLDNNETALRAEERALLSTQLDHAHVLGNAADNEHRSEEALAIYTAAMQASSTLVNEARVKLAAAKAAEAREGERVIETDDEDSSTESTPLRGRLKNNLRIAVQLQHQCTFFAATAHYQIKVDEKLTTPDSDRFKELEGQEVDLYEKAKMLRKEILRDTFRKSENLMNRIKEKHAAGTFVKMPKIKDIDGLGGIENQRIVETADDLFEVLRAQARVVVEWRAKMAEYLSKPLVDQDEGVDSITGDEYEDSTKLQDELYVYFDAVKAMQADMNRYVTGEAAPLIDHEVKQAVKWAKEFLDPTRPDELKRIVHAPELTLELMAIRNKHAPNKERDLGSVRALIQEARNLETSLGWGTRQAEVTFVHKHLNALQSVFQQYTKALNELEKEVELFRQAQNQRLQFYSHLQEVSDAVKPYKDELDPTLDLAALQIVTNDEEALKRRVAELRTKNRFLQHLQDDSSQSEPKICVVCQCPFEIGVLTVCGHQYCKECITHWWHEHKSCPLCKRRLTNADFHNISYKPQQMRAQQETDAGPSGAASDSQPSSSRQSSIYSDIDTHLLDEIKAIDLPSSYGTKIDTLGRHLHWLREHDPGAKSIVFSQYREFLDVLGTALSDFKLGHRRLGRTPNAAEKFKHDPSVDCLLLDAKTDSSGLTLVCATHVFVCEPLIQTAVELQAIARVHRIGQTRGTTVWMYLVNDTVEEAIYEVSVARRLAHVQARRDGREQEVGGKAGKARAGMGMGAGRGLEMEAVEAEEMQSQPLSKLLVAGKGGGEVVGNEDLWRCLFGKMQKGGGEAVVSEAAEGFVGRHLRAEAAEERRAVAGAERE